MGSPIPHLSAEAAANLPRHVAVIMNGNGRWVKIPRLQGIGVKRNFVP
jgi:undecaprenyl pyrophosphate synthase